MMPDQEVFSSLSFLPLVSYFAKSGKEEMRWKVEAVMSKCKHKGGPGEL